MSVSSKFTIGQLIQHRLFGYRGVIYEVDPIFMLSEQWYQQMAKSCPPKDEPWYHVLVDNAIHTTYVAQQNLIADPYTEPVKHPGVDQLFERFEDGIYYLRQRHLQ